MDNQKLERTFLTRCCHYTAACLFMAASALLLALLVRGGPANGLESRASEVQPMRSSAQMLNLNNISLDSIVFTRDSSQFNRVNVYLSNSSDRAGLIQLRFVTVDADNEAAFMQSWERRRVPRFDVLVYSMEVPDGLDPSSITLYVKDHAADIVREFQLASYGDALESYSYSTDDELYTQNYGG